MSSSKVVLAKILCLMLINTVTDAWIKLKKY